MNITNINKLGINYNVIDDDGKKLKQVKVIYHTDFLASLLGEYNEEFYEDSDDYVKSSMARLSGFIPLHQLYWHTCSEEEFDVIDVLYNCMATDASYAIVEFIPPSEMLYCDSGRNEDDEDFYNDDEEEDDVDDDYYDD